METSGPGRGWHVAVGNEEKNVELANSVSLASAVHILVNKVKSRQEVSVVPHGRES